MAGWGSLETAKLFVALLTPIAVAMIGFFLSNRLKQLDLKQWRSQKLVEKRLSVYDDLVPDLNKLLCYFSYVGDWRDLNPGDIVLLKRKIDRKIHLAAPLFSPIFFGKAMTFLQLCYKTFNEWGRDATLKTKFGRRKESRPDWKAEWELCFADEVSDIAMIKNAYREVVEIIARDIGVHEGGLVPPAGRSPDNIR
jgi:hypothetical protein